MAIHALVAWRSQTTYFTAAPMTTSAMATNRRRENRRSVGPKIAPASALGSARKRAGAPRAPRTRAPPIQMARPRCHRKVIARYTQLGIGGGEFFHASAGALSSDH